MNTALSLRWIALTLITFSAAAKDATWPKTDDSRSQICVDRPESMGVLNIRQADVVIEDGASLRLAGGQAACAFVGAGKHTVWVQSPNPYNPASMGPITWKSPSIVVRVEKGSSTKLRVCAHAQAKTYIGWAIYQGEEPCE